MDRQLECHARLRLPTRFDEFLQAIHPDDRSGLSGLHRPRDAAEVVLRVRVPDSRRRMARVRWWATKGKVFCEGEAARIIGIAMDITERRLLEDHLRSAHKLESIGLLAGGIAHDFNNLLTGILGNASLAQELLPPDARIRPAPVERGAGQRTGRRPDAATARLFRQGPLRRGAARLSLLVGEITHLLQATIPKRSNLKLELAPDLPAVEADSSQVQQVIMNLVINAAEAIGDRPGAVTVRTSLRRRATTPPASGRSASPATTSVWKSAMTAAAWMTPPRRAFSTRSSPRNSPAAGSGWPPLSGIVRSHRGAIRVKSAPGQGSAFEVLFAAMTEPVRAARRGGTVRGPHRIGPRAGDRR